MSEDVAEASLTSRNISPILDRERTIMIWSKRTSIAELTAKASNSKATAIDGSAVKVKASGLEKSKSLVGNLLDSREDEPNAGLTHLELGFG